MEWFKKHKILTVILVIVVIAVISSAASGGDKSSNSSGSSVAKPAEQQAATAKVGEPARDGKFEFTVKEVKCGVPNVGKDYSTQTAQGQYCLVTLSVKNIGNEAQGFFSANQKLLNAQSQQFAADDMATIIANPDYQTLWSNINPGNSVEGVVVFDLPKDQTPAAAQLHDSAFSNGVKVNL